MGAGFLIVPRVCGLNEHPLINYTNAFVVAFLACDDSSFGLAWRDLFKNFSLLIFHIQLLF